MSSILYILHTKYVYIVENYILVYFIKNRDSRLYQQIRSFRDWLLLLAKGQHGMNDKCPQRQQPAGDTIGWRLNTSRPSGRKNQSLGTKGGCVRKTRDGQV